MEKPKQELLELNIKPKKSFGQNFLVDSYYNLRIIEAIKKFNNFEQTNILEIGAGTGALTQHLVDNFSCIWSVEKDRDLIPVLQQKFHQEIRSQKLILIENNIIKFDFTTLFKTNQSGLIVGNLPYHLTSSILFLVINNWEIILGAVFLIQKEVAERLCASPNNKTYGFLTVLLNLAFKITKIKQVPREAFWPIPKVDSTIIKLEQRDLGISQLEDPQDFFKFVKIIFQQRRKKLSTILKNKINLELVHQSGLDLNLRPENFTPQQFINLYKFYDPTLQTRIKN